MQKHPEITRSRLRSFIARGKLHDRLYLRHAPVELAVFSTQERITFAEAAQGSYREARVGEQFGPLWSTHWFKVGIEIPKDWKGAEVHLRWDSSSEACVWQDGVPLQGLTGTGHPMEGAQPIRAEFIVLRPAQGGERITLHVEVACNHLIDSADKLAFLGKLRLAEIAEFDRRAWDLLWDLMVIAEMALHLPQKTPRAAQALYAANEMLNKMDLDDPSHMARVPRRRRGVLERRQWWRAAHGPCHWPCPSGHGVALARRGDEAQGLPHVLHGPALHGFLS